jgi:hypothetical protein
MKLGLATPKLIQRGGCFNGAAPEVEPTEPRAAATGLDASSQCVNDSPDRWCPEMPAKNRLTPLVSDTKR